MTFLSHSHRRTRASRHALLCASLAAAVLCGGSAVAQDVPEGYPIGNWILSPKFGISYEEDNNVFRLERDTQRDQVARYDGELTASLPFGNSMFELEYGARQANFEKNDFPRTLEHFVGFVEDPLFEAHARLEQASVEPLGV